MVDIARWNGSEWVPCFALSEEQYETLLRQVRPLRPGKPPTPVRMLIQNGRAWARWRMKCLPLVVPALQHGYVFEGGAREAARTLCYSADSLVKRFAREAALNLENAGLVLSLVKDPEPEPPIT